MKALITLAAIIALSSTSFSYAGTNGKGERTTKSNNENALSRKINSKVHYPSNITGNIEAIVSVNLTVNTDGTLQVNKITSTDERVVASIKSQLTQIQLKPGSDQIGKTYDYRFVLKVQH